MRATRTTDEWEELIGLARISLTALGAGFALSVKGTDESQESVEIPRLIALNAAAFCSDLRDMLGEVEDHLL